MSRCPAFYEKLSKLKLAGLRGPSQSGILHNISKCPRVTSLPRLPPQLSYHSPPKTPPFINPPQDPLRKGTPPNSSPGPPTWPQPPRLPSKDTPPPLPPPPPTPTKSPEDLTLLASTPLAVPTPTKPSLVSTPGPGESPPS